MPTGKRETPHPFGLRIAALSEPQALSLWERGADAVSTPGPSANTRSAVGERRRLREKRKRRLVILASSIGRQRQR